MKMNDYIRRWDNSNRKWIYEHREVVEKHIGRKLKSSEHVHHIDENPKNNDLNNLKVVSPQEHAKIHKPAIKNRTCSYADCDKKHHAKGLCKSHYKSRYVHKTI